MSLHLDGLRQFVFTMSRAGYQIDVPEKDIWNLQVTPPSIGKEIHFRICAIFHGLLLAIETVTTQILRGLALILSGLCTFNANRIRLGFSDLVSALLQGIALPILGLVAVFAPSQTMKEVAYLTFSKDRLIQEKSQELVRNPGGYDYKSQAEIFEFAFLWDPRSELSLHRSISVSHDLHWSGSSSHKTFVTVCHKIQAFILFLFSIPVFVVQTCLRLVRSALTFQWENWNGTFGIAGIGNSYSVSPTGYINAKVTQKTLSNLAQSFATAALPQPEEVD